MDTIETPVSQVGFFVYLLELFDTAKGEILIYGYDKPFMEREGAIHALRRAAIKNVRISAILPKEVVTPLDRLSKEYKNIDLARMPPDISFGYTVFDCSACYFWDSNKDTPYEPEKQTGVYWRKLMRNTIPLGELMSKIFGTSRISALAYQ